jgi:signal transduction histidine kinase/CheY-like chemotaxis protein
MASIRRDGPIAHLSLTVSYVLTGRVALLLAVSPGYASPIFPPAGIAVAAMLIGGRRTLPWTFLGSLLLNLWIGLGIDGRLGGRAAAGAVIIAAASTVQAALAGWALRRAIGYPTALDAGQDLRRFLSLSSLCCLSSATLSLTGLFGLGIVAKADLTTSWISWWIGDTLGVLVVLPLILVFAGEPRQLWRSRIGPVAVPMLLFFALFVAIFVRVNRWEADDSLLEFRLLSQQVADRIRSGLDEQQLALEELARSIERPAPLSRSEFRALVRPLLQRFPTLQAVEWAPRVGDADRARFEAAQRAERPGFAIRDIGPSGPAPPAGERQVYYPVTYLEPLRGNLPAIGVDLLSNPERAAALRRTIATGAVAATTPIRLVQETGRQAGMLLLLAVPDGSSGPGAVLTVLRMGSFIDGLLASSRMGIRAEFVDRDQGPPLFDNLATGGDPGSYEVDFAFAGRHYRLRTEPSPSYLAAHQMWQSWAVLVGGVFSTGLLGALLLLGTGYTQRVERVVESRTRDLEAANRHLQIEITERQQAEAALRQAQRLEAIGQLTGGIAHDFNNLLTVVEGNAALLLDAAQDPKLSQRAAAIMRAAERGERLTRQLLAFSRRQTLRPDTIDLQQRRGEIADLLSRSLREDVALSVDLPDGLWPVSVDPTEFELALLNIGVNARDAMPNGGGFRLAARNLVCRPGDIADEALSGDFVALTLSDTGGGMEPEVSAHAFEPYFTTKGTGQGSGLGLSQVYGFARQSGGAARIESETGKGTAITLYLPRAAGPAEPAAEVERPAPPELPAVKVLLVEDDPDVAEAARALLHDIGCEVLVAGDGAEALSLVDRDATIALVLSDIVMPGGFGGLDLARQLRQRHPDLTVLLATGYSRFGPQAVAEGFEIIEKPYHREALIAAVRAAALRGKRAAGAEPGAFGI